MRELATGRLLQNPISVVTHEVGVSADRNRGARGGGGGREGEDGTGHQRADRANGEDGGSEDVSPNSHSCLHAFTQVTAQTLVRRPYPDDFVRSPVFG